MIRSINELKEILSEEEMFEIFEYERNINLRQYAQENLPNRACNLGFELSEEELEKLSNAFVNTVFKHGTNNDEALLECVLDDFLYGKENAC